MRSKVSRAALLLFLFFGFDKVLAIVRQVLTARIFGLSADLDAFNAANNLPDLLFALISGGALAIAFIPVLTEKLTLSGKAEAWRLFSRIANLAFIVTAVLGVFIAIFANQLVGWRLGIAPGFSTEQQLLVAQLMRLNLIATLIFSLSGLVMASLQANQHFLLPAIAPLLYNLGQIVGALILAPSEGIHLGPVTLPAFGLGIYGLVYGVIGGSALHLLVQIPGLLRYGFKWWPELALRSDDVRKVLRLLGPRLLTMLFIQLIFIYRDNLASSLETGAVSALTYGWMLMQVPETLIGTAIGTAMLPTLAEYAARKEWETFTGTIQKAVRVLVAATLPIAVIMSLGLGPLVKLAFGFDDAGTRLVMMATSAYLAGLTVHALIEVAARAFYSRQNAKIPLLASAVTVVVFVASGYFLVRWLGAAGIALATSFAFGIEMLFLFIIHIRQLPGRIIPVGTIYRTIGAMLAAGLLTWLNLTFLPLSPWMSAVIAMSIGFLAAVWITRRDLIILREM